MRSLLHGVLWLGIWFSPQGWTEAGFGQYQYQYQPQAPTAGQYPGYQWRPGEAQYSYQSEEQIHTFRDGSEIISDPSHPVMAFPPGTYRPLEETNRIAPQIGAYRFRNLTEDEKSRIVKTEQQNHKDDRKRAQTRFNFRGYDGPSMMGLPGSANSLYFRPDDRFIDHGPQQAYPYYPNQPQDSYSPSYWQPLFRQDKTQR
jgi:hypothetical protein